MNVEGAKGECNFGQHEIGFLYDDVVVTADNHAVYKTVAKEIAVAARQVDHVHGEVQRARGQLLPHPPVAARAPTATIVFWDDEAGAPHAALRQLRRRRARDDGGLHAALRAEHQLLQAVRRRARSRRPRSPGARTTAPAPCAWSARGPARGWRTGCPGGDVNPYLALAAMMAGGLHGIENELTARAAAGGQRLHLRRARRCRGTLREAREAFARLADRPGRLRRRGRRPLHEHGRRRARGLRRRRHRLGAAPRLRDGCEHDHPHRRSTRRPAEPVTEVPLGVGRGDRRAHRARGRGVPGLAGRRPGGAGHGCCAGSPRSSTRTSRSSPSSRSATPGTRSATRAGRPATSATCLNYYSAAPERLFGRQIPVAGGIDVTFHEPLGVVGVIVPVELPDADRRLGLRARAGRRQHAWCSSRPS